MDSPRAAHVLPIADAGVDAQSADAKVNALNYPHGRSTIVDTATLSSQGVSIRTATVDVILTSLDLCKVPNNLDLLVDLLAPSGVAAFLVYCTFCCLFPHPGTHVQPV